MLNSDVFFFQDGTMDNYIKLLQEHKVSHLVCATDQLYKTEELTKSGNKSSKTWWSVVGRC